MRGTLKKHGTLLARILIGGFFLLSGIQAALGGAAFMASFISEMGIPFATILAWLIVLVKIGGGAGILLGWHFDCALILVAGFTLLTVVFVHNSFDDVGLFKNLGLIGGMLYMLAYGPGDGWRLGKKSAAPMPADAV